MSSPTVSICIPTFNRAALLGEAIDSALRQPVDAEVIVYDDASTDDTHAVLARYDGRIREFRNPQNAGISETRNRCVAVARGRFIAWLDSDDAYLDGGLPELLALLERYATAGMAHGGFRVVGADGRPLPDWPAAFASETVEPGRSAFAELLLSNYITASTTLVRRECYERVGGYALELSRSGEDWELWMRIALHYDLAYTPRPIAAYRYHGESSSAETSGSGDRLRLDELAVRRVLRIEGSSAGDPAQRKRAFAALAVRALVRAGDLYTLRQRTRSATTIVHALRLFPRLVGSPHWAPLFAATLRRDDYGVHRHSKALLAQLYRLLEGTRFGERIKKFAAPDPTWTRTLEEIAESVRRTVPPTSAIAVVDKNDPTLLHLSGRRGWHYPDLELLRSGYPESSDEAVGHLEELRRRGAAYFVLPAVFGWWLEQYDGLRRYLDGFGRAFADENCVIYRLTT